MSQPKVYEFAKEIGMETIALMDKIREWDLPVKSHMAALNEEVLSTIRERLESESDKAKGKKKTKKKAAKKTAAKKTAAKKTVAKKAATAKKKATTTKKAVTKKKVVKKAVAKKTAAKKTAGAAKKTVIRRKAGTPTAEELKAAAQAEAEEIAKAEAAALAAAEQVEYQEVAQGQDGEVVQAAVESTEEDTPSVKEETPAPAKTRGNIVGRMDLSRITPPATRGADAGSRPSRTTPQRNIRTGFVAPPPMQVVVPAVEDKKKEDKTPKKKAGTGGKEVPVQNFLSAEFRKREVIFQPKKKRQVVVRDGKKTQITTPKASKRVVKVHDTIKLSELAGQLGIKAPQLTRKLIGEGIMANMNTVLDFDTVSLIVPEFGFEAQNLHRSVDELLEITAFGDLEAESVNRPPVVTVMGHVDHGKTTLLDAIRRADVAKGEAGGITQHIGAYRVRLEEGKVATFIDTPGHEAFTAMRARGANVTDIVILVVAADDGPMPQTLEAISHAKAAGVPIIVAVNKMDRPGANPENIKKQLTEHELIPEDWGGQTIFCEVSALKQEGIKELLEQVHLVAEMEDIKGNPKRSGTGVVIESRVHKGRGNVATVLVKDGTVKKGQFFVAGKVFGKIRNMLNDQGKQVKEAGPGEPAEIIGLDETPNAGDRFDICKDEESARIVAEERRRSADSAEEVPSSKMSLEDLFAKVKSGDVQELPVVLKTDVAGSVEAIRGIFDKIQTDEVKVKIIHSAVGGISESDVLLASTAGGLIIGFNVRPDAGAQRLSKEKGVEIKTYSVIYNLGDDIKAALSGLLAPDIVEKVLGQAEVRETFSVPKIGMIAGCSVTDGKIVRSSMARLIRDGKVIYTGKISSLKRFKDDAKEVTSGYECGIGIENYNDLKAGDVIEAYMEEEIAREL